MGIDYLRSMRFSLIHGEEMKNKYFYRSRISEAKFREIVRHFAMDINEGQDSFTLWSKSEYSEFYLLKNQVKNHRIYLDKYSGLWRI